MEIDGNYSSQGKTTQAPLNPSSHDLPFPLIHSFSFFTHFRKLSQAKTLPSLPLKAVAVITIMGGDFSSSTLRARKL